MRFDGEVSFAARLLTFMLMRLLITLRLAAGCFLFCTREAFERAGGFDERFFASEEIWMSRALKRQGLFVMVRDHVVTSGRKVRMHGVARLLWTALAVGLRGPKAVQRREGLDLWYDGRRDVV